jgi:hypothetical protein
MQDRNKRNGHQRDQLEEAVDLLVDRTDLTSGDDIGHIPQRSNFVQQEAGDHQSKKWCGDLEKYAGEDTNADLDQHQQVQERFFDPCLFNG